MPSGGQRASGPALGTATNGTRLLPVTAARPQGWVGQITESLGIGLLPFTFSSLVIASVIYSLPFTVQPIQNVFIAIGRRCVHLLNIEVGKNLYAQVKSVALMK